MKLIRNPELKGILILLLIAVVLGGTLAVATGKLEQWFGITWGAKALDGIVYVSDRSGSDEIWLVNTNGSNARRVTKGMRIGSVPAVSANGSRIIFVGVKGQDIQVMTVRPDGKGLGPISSSGSVAHPAFSPDGKNAAYVANGKVYVCKYDGSSPATVLPSDAEIHSAMTNTLDRSQLPPYTLFSWGPDSKGMAGVTQDPTGDEVLVFLPEAGDKPQMIPARMLLSELLKQMGADGEIPGGVDIKIKDIVWASREMVFTTPIVVGENEGTFLVTFVIENGKLQVADVKTPNGVVTGVALSPDGANLAFSVADVAKDKPNGIVVVNLQDQNSRLAAEGNFMSLSYSPDGDRLLAVQVDPKGLKRNVVTVDLDSGKVKKITKDGHSFSPVWTPVSKK